MGAPRAIALCRCFGGALDFLKGRWSSAESSLQEAIRLYRDLGSASGEALSLQRLGVLLTARGRLPEALALFDEGLFAAERAVMRSHCVTRLHASIARNRLAAADVPGAAEAMRQGAEASRRHGDCLTCEALLLPEAVRVAVRLGRDAEADQRARLLEDTATRFASRTWTAMARQARGRVELAAGRALASLASLREAREAFRQAGQPYEAARCALLVAEAIERTGPDAVEADTLRAEARATYAALGAAGVED